MGFCHDALFEEVKSFAAGDRTSGAHEHGPNLLLPHSRAFGGGLFELRPRGKSGIGRAFYSYLIGHRVVVLHAFIKKSQQTPVQEIKLARKRMKEIQNG